MELAALDNVAVNHHCWLQRCSLAAKVGFVVVALALLITSRSLGFLGLQLLVVLGLALSNRLPIRMFFGLLAFPLIFSGIIALSLGDVPVGLLLVGRALAAAGAVVVVFLTTPPMRLLAFISAPLPGVFGELLYFTYRSFFLLWQSLDKTITAVRLRGGFAPKGLKRLKVAAEIYGTTLVRGWDMAGRQYMLLRLRGLEQGLAIQRSWSLSKNDWALLGLCIFLMGGWFLV